MADPSVKARLSPLGHGQKSKVDGRPWETFKNLNQSGITYRMMKLKWQLDEIGHGDWAGKEIMKARTISSDYN
jgi:hypothetical protein